MLLLPHAALSGPPATAGIPKDGWLEWADCYPSLCTFGSPGEISVLGINTGVIVTQTPHLFPMFASRYLLHDRTFGGQV